MWIWMPRRHLAVTRHLHATSGRYGYGLCGILAARDLKRSNRPFIPNKTLYTHDSVLSNIDTESNNLRIHMVHQRLSIRRQSESERHTFRRNNKTAAFGRSTVHGLNDVNQLSVRVTISALIVWRLAHLLFIVHRPVAT